MTILVACLELRHEQGSLQVDCSNLWWIEVSVMNQDLSMMEHVFPINGGTSHQRNRIHDYSHQQNGCTYVFDAIDDCRGYVTSQGGKLKPGDCLLLKLDQQVESYEIEGIDYYAEPSDMWIALVRKLETL